VVNWLGSFVASFFVLLAKTQDSQQSGVKAYLIPASH
jgi:fluoride ion exporter CrcB/FEX